MLEEAVRIWAGTADRPGPTIGNVTGERFSRDEVTYVVGARWKQRYLVPDAATGNLQFLDKQFNRGTGAWEDYREANDWNTQCAACHTTGYRITASDPQSGKTTGSAFAEPGVGCEACHGPGSEHAASSKHGDIFNDDNARISERSIVCGYCHIRLENSRWRTAQGAPREDLPAPELGRPHIAGEDWTRWYPHQVIIPGVQAEDPFDAPYAGDLAGMFNTDERARQSGIYEEAKHHQQYQGFIQSSHYTSGALSCITCHAPHSIPGKPVKLARETCINCHDASYTVEKYMPNTGQTAPNLFVRSHTFNSTPRKGGPGADRLGPPDYYGD